MYKNSCVEQECTNPGRLVGRTKEFCNLASNIYRSSLCNMLRVTILTQEFWVASRFSEYLFPPGVDCHLCYTWQY